MNTPKDLLRSFLNRIRHLSFFQRLFYWKTIRNELIDATEALSRLESDLERLQDNSQQLNHQLGLVNNNCTNLDEKARSLETELSANKENIRHIEQKLSE